MSDDSSASITVNALLEPLLDAIADRVARRLRADTTPASRWIPLRESPLGYRPTLELIRTGELAVHGIGHRKYLDCEQVDCWLSAHPIAVASKPLGEPDEIDAIVSASRQRQAKRKGTK